MVNDKQDATSASPGKTDQIEDANFGSDAQAQFKKGKKAPKSKKKFITLGVIVAVIVVAGVGFGVWHNQPSFCNSVCHSPMDNYVNGYYNNSTESAGANTHQVNNVTCLQCHEATLEEQLSEASAWVQGSYQTDSNGSLHKTLVTADKKMCAKSGCHDWNEVVAATENWGGNSGVNPHRSHQGEAIDCSNCHGVHTQSMMYCNTCHEFKVPDGWATPTKTTSSEAATSQTTSTSAEQSAKTN